jgi:pantoate--beta-alanine ligase
LNADERKAAPALYRALQEARKLIRAGERDLTKIRQVGLAVLNESPLIRVDYFEIVDPDDLQPVSELNGPVSLAAAIWIGSTRLIDNVLAAERR